MWRLVPLGTRGGGGVLETRTREAMLMVDSRGAARIPEKHLYSFFYSVHKQALHGSSRSRPHTVRGGGDQHVGLGEQQEVHQGRLRHLLLESRDSPPARVT